MKRKRLTSTAPKNFDGEFRVRHKYIKGVITSQNPKKSLRIKGGDFGKNSPHPQCPLPYTPNQVRLYVLFYPAGSFKVPPRSDMKKGNLSRYLQNSIAFPKWDKKANLHVPLSINLLHLPDIFPDNRP